VMKVVVSTPVATVEVILHVAAVLAVPLVRRMWIELPSVRHEVFPIIIEFLHSLERIGAEIWIRVVVPPRLLHFFRVSPVVSLVIGIRIAPIIIEIHILFCIPVDHALPSIP